jgi:hypothetical protein
VVEHRFAVARQRRVFGVWHRYVTHVRQRDILVDAFRLPVARLTRYFEAWRRWARQRKHLILHQQGQVQIGYERNRNRDARQMLQRWCMHKKTAFSCRK